MVKSSLLYSIGSVLFSLSSMLWLIVVTRNLNSIDSGIFSIGWAVCQQMATIGYFGMRNVQVSDVDNKINPINFIVIKLFTIVSMIIVAILYVMYLGLSAEKSTVAILLTLLMAAEVLADLSAGFFQKHDRLDITGLSYIIRVSLYSTAFIVALLLYKSLIISIIVAIIISFLWLLVFDIPLLIKLDFFNFETPTFKSLHKLIIMCVPIFMSSYLTNLLITIPKNSIEVNLTTIDQSTFNLVFMPSSIMKMILGILLIPLYRKITLAWKEKKHQELELFIIKIILFIFIVTVLLLFLSVVAGIPVLSSIYGVDISSQKYPLIILIAAGSINGVAVFLIFILTVLNKQFFLIYIYGLTVIVSLFVTKFLVIKYHILGASISYLLSSFMLFVSLFLLSFIFIRREKNIN